MKIRKDNATVNFVTENGVMKAVGSRAGLFIVINRNYGGRELYFNTPAEGNYVFKKLLEDGYTRVAEKKVAAPKANKCPSWDFGPDGFDRQKYMETARTIPGATYVDPRWGIKVKKSFREKVYIAMGGKKIR